RQFFNLRANPPSLAAGRIDKHREFRAPKLQPRFTRQILRKPPRQFGREWPEFHLIRDSGIELAHPLDFGLVVSFEFVAARIEDDHHAWYRLTQKIGQRLDAWKILGIGGASSGKRRFRARNPDQPVSREQR